LAQSFPTPVDGATTFERRELEDQTNRILGSANFRTSPVLQTFLRFIVAKAMDCQEDKLTEQLIATEVFSRPSNFDCSVDTVVRTHAYRLRQKLKEYYAGQGLADLIVIDVPKGHYRARFSRRDNDLHFSSPPHSAEEASPPDRKTSVQPGVIIAGGAVAALMLLAAGMWLGTQLRVWERAAVTAETAPALAEVDQFWSQFLGSDKAPIIAYSNDLYLSTESGNLLMFSGPAADRGTMASPEAARLGVPGFDLLRNTGPLFFEDDKTDVGEVVSASVLTAQLVRMGVHPTLKRGRVITTYDLESHNVIFVGSPFSNKILKEIEGNANFVFRDEPTRPNLWGGAIRNLHPLTGESRSYFLERDANNGALKADYAVVTSLPGLAPSRKILVLGGLTTSGTQAAAQFVTSAAGIAEMLSRLERKKTRAEQWPSHFEYLLRVTLDRGLDLLRTQCLASRKRADSEAGSH
jgi:hypothetical protein